MVNVVAKRVLKISRPLIVIWPAWLMNDSCARWRYQE